MMKIKVLLVSTVLVLLSVTLSAQEDKGRFGIEINGGVSKAVNELSGAKLNTGFGFEGILQYRILEHTGVYLGWGWNRFGSDASFAGNDVCFEETGYVFGLQFKHPVHNSKMSYYFRTAALYNHIETENAQGDIINDSKHGYGFQLAGGIDFPIGKSWTITPGVKFNSLTRDTEFESTSKNLKHNYLSLRIGFNKTF